MKLITALLLVNFSSVALASDENQQQNQPSATDVKQQPVKTAVVAITTPSATSNEPAIAVVKQLPVTAENEQPVVTAKQQPVITEKQQPGATAKQLPVITEKQQPGATAKQLPVITEKQQPGATAKQLPVITEKQQPGATAKQLPVITEKQQSGATAKQLPVITEKQQPVSTVKEKTVKAPLKLAPLPDDVEGKPSRFGYIRKLISTSSGAKQVKSSNSTKAQMHYRIARQHYADAAIETDTKKINALLDKTVREMYKAIRLASPKELTNRKKKHDFDRRLKSVEALQTAFNRVAEEKKKTDDAEKLNKHVAEIKAQAQVLYKKKKFDLARGELDSAYLLIKSSIGNLRSGDTLVRELNFASKEEEYHYEIDRNDTHQMLLKLLVSKKLATRPESFKKRINDRVDLAKTIRAEAEAYATDGDYDEAVKALERSTKQLVRAIRMGGVFIPG